MSTASPAGPSLAGATSSSSPPPGHGARFVVGIDLGTTNSVVAYADTQTEAPAIRVLEIPQLTAPGSVEARTTLPSFLYVAAKDELPPEQLRLPWKGEHDRIVGDFARRRGAEVPARLVSSAKSWLSYAAADRTAPILPWGSPDEVPKLSPVEVSTHYLAHIRHAWDAAHKGAPLAAQDILLTVPASFDAAARELTLRAAHAAGLESVTILEEPQAAFYAWIDAKGDAWREAVRVGDVVLVCDIGGGTTDFTLIAVREDNGVLVPERVAVGDHILLGGDNMDLALSYHLQQRLLQAKTAIDAWQFRSLTLSCRDAKERLLSTDSRDSKLPIAILGRGRKVIGGSVRLEVERADVDQALIDGFFPNCPLDAQPQAQRRTGLQELGLPYASDPGITRHLAQFLNRHGKTQAVEPTAVLFNGGVMRADTLRERLVGVVRGWFRSDAPMRVLDGGDPEHAVARGAAYYGLARRGRGVRIRGGTARSYYIGIETAMPAVPGMRPPIKALCVVPRGVEEGSDLPLPPQELHLVVGEPAEFRFLSSATRRDDTVGSLIESWDDDITEMEPMQTTLAAEGQEGAMIPVRLQGRVTELGLLELWCVSRDGSQRWKLELNVRARPASEVEPGA